jgi:serine/threonine-protein kinase RsbW
MSADRPVTTTVTDETIETIDLDLPLAHRHASTVRVVAASLAADVGFSVDEIDELRLGVDEVVSIMADAEGTGAARIHLRFVLSDHTITVTVTRSGVAETITRGHVDELAVRILSAVVDRFEVSEGTFVVSKRTTAAHGG